MSRLASRNKNKNKNKNKKIYPSRNCIASLADNLALRAPYSCYRFRAASGFVSAESCV